MNNKFKLELYKLVHGYNKNWICESKEFVESTYFYKLKDIRDNDYIEVGIPRILREDGCYVYDVWLEEFDEPNLDIYLDDEDMKSELSREECLIKEIDLFKEYGLSEDEDWKQSFITENDWRNNFS